MLDLPLNREAWCLKDISILKQWIKLQAMQIPSLGFNLTGLSHASCKPKLWSTTQEPKPPRLLAFMQLLHHATCTTHLYQYPLLLYCRSYRLYCRYPRQIRCLFRRYTLLGSHLQRYQLLANSNHVTGATNLKKTSTPCNLHSIQLPIYNWTSITQPWHPKNHRYCLLRHNTKLLLLN